MRINRAGDDAAGLAISEKMRGQIRGLKQAQRNAQDGISLIQTAEGALNETHSILQRMRELAVQAATDTNTLTDRKEIQKEINQLLDEIDRIGNDTEFNTQKLLDGSYENKKIHIGANADQGMDISVIDMRAAALGGGSGVSGGSGATDAEVTITSADPEVSVAIASTSTYEGEYTLVVKWDGVNSKAVATLTGPGNVDETVDITEGAGDYIVGDITFTIDESDIPEDDGGGFTVTLEVTPYQDAGEGEETGTGGSIADLKVSDVDSVTEDDVAAGTAGGVLTQAGADAAITNINDAIEQVSAERSKLGAIQNRLEHTINNLGTSAENLQAAEARIRDLDMAEEIMAFTKNNILQQAATAMLAQANMAPQSVLQLLG